MVSYSEYAKEWGQSLIIAVIVSFTSVFLFVFFGGINFDTERGRLALFVFTFSIGILATYVALFKWKKRLDIFG